ncbi:MAG: NUDIX domain-containing protein [Propionibacteriaceae bacterium]|jgi:8-oxo-dGTP diphosphatase|nr:NUDIX domain-containing protein [Propionibacteriaceae bacterium]
MSAHSPAPPDRPTPIWAAGAVAWRSSDGRPAETVLVHRPAYDDWTLPKGKAEDDECLPATAVREVWEETGLRVRLGPPLRPLRYFVGHRLKLVAWWQGVILSQRERTAAAAEIDQAIWLSADQAVGRLTHADERALLEESRRLAATTPLLLIRHAQAVKRHRWSGADRDRPLTEEGRSQLLLLGQILSAYGVVDLVTSPARRCRASLTGALQPGSVVPTAEAARRPDTPDTPDGPAQTAATAPDEPNPSAVSASGPSSGVTPDEPNPGGLGPAAPTVVEALSEEAAAQDPAGLERYAARLAATVARSGRPTAVCLHRPTLPRLLAALGQPDRPLAPAAAVVLHLDRSGRPAAVEWHDSARVRQLP